MTEGFLNHPQKEALIVVGILLLLAFIGYRYLQARRVKRRKARRERRSEAARNRRQ